MEKERFLTFNGETIKYYLKVNQQQKRIVLRIKNAQIHVSTPPFAPRATIEQLITNNWTKINQLQTKFEVNQKYDLFTTNPWMKIFDQKVELVLVDEALHPKMLSHQLMMKNYHDQAEQLKKIYAFLGQYYKNWFLQQSQKYATLMNLSFKHLTIKNLVGKWGACYPKEQKLLFNARLLHFPIAVIDCVIVHELAHLVHPNHSKRFWSLVYQYQPQYQQWSAFLDNWAI